MPFDAIAAIASMLVLFIPGVALSFALLKGTAFGRFDKIVFGLMLGLVAVPLLSFLEYFFFGIKFNALLVIANALFVLFASIAWLYLQKHEFGLPTFAFNEKEWKTYTVYGLLVLIMLTGFYVRFATAWAPDFFEFDPYYYEKLTERLVQNGVIPMYTTESYFPRQAFMHWAPLSHYLTGSWFVLHQLFTGAAYDQATLILVSQLYPPIVAALLSFVVFALIREEFNAYLAIIPAALFALTPQLIKKFAAGVAEQQPWGILTALLLLTLLVIAIKRRSYRIAAFAALAALASILGSQQYIWPVMILAAFISVQGLLDYLANRFDTRKTIIQGAVVASFVAGNFIMALYQNQAYFRFDTPHIVFLASSFGIYLLLHGTSVVLKLQGILHRFASLGAIFAVLAIASLFVNVDDVALNTITTQAEIAGATTPVGKTVQEEGQTVPELYPSAFGVLNPNHLILLATLLTLLTTSVYLASKKHYRVAVGVLLIGLIGIVLNPWMDAALNVLSAIPYKPLQALLQLITSSDVFTYMLITLAAAAVLYLVAEHKSETPLLLVFIFFPIAFIGLNKLKFLLHLAVAVVIVFGYLLGESLRLFEHLNHWLRFAQPGHVRLGVTVVLLLAGGITTTLQANTVDQSMKELQITRIPSDWFEAYKWLRENTPLSSRVLSWWDYGHWTTFFGQRATVLDPINQYGDFDQEVAQAFVNGEDEDLYYVMESHQATHILVDSDLIGKWGALVFLSGTCSRQESLTCPEKAEADWKPGPGNSKYELQKYFEQLLVRGECPASISPAPLVLVQSGFGAFYCAGKNEYFLATQEGLNTSFKRNYKILGQDNIKELDENTSYWVPMGQNRFLNINPYLEPFGAKSGAFKSAFARFYFLEQFPGFKKAYVSQNGAVKIFEYTGKPRPLPSNN